MDKKIKIFLFVSFFLSMLLFFGFINAKAEEPTAISKIIDKTTCDFTYCCSELTITDYNATTLSKFEASKTTDMVTKIGNIRFSEITKLKTGQIRVCGYIHEISNYWGIKDLWDSTWWNNSFKYSVNISSNQAPNKNESITFYMSNISSWNKSQIQADCDDIRIVNSSDNGQIDYFVDICNTTDVRVGFLNTYNASGVIAKAYWGYASAEAQNKSMRMFYDDFDNGVFDYTVWNKTQKCVANMVITEADGVVNVTNVGANSYCAVIWYKNTTTLSGETAYAKIKFMANSGSTGLGVGIINTTSNNNGRMLCRRYDDSTKVALDDDSVANGVGIAISGLNSNVWWWGMIYQNGSTTTGKAWVITNNEPVANTNLASYSQRAGWFGLYLTSTPAYIQYYDDFQIWNVGYRPTFYGNSSTITLGSIMENTTTTPAGATPYNGTGGFNDCMPDNVTLVKTRHILNNSVLTNQTEIFFCEYGCDDSFNRCRDNPLLELAVIVGIIMIVITILVLFFRKVVG